MSMEVHIMNKKVLSLGVMLSLVTTGAFAADVVTTSVNNGDQLSKYQKEAIQLTQKQLAEKSVLDSKTYERTLALNEARTVDLALANNRTAKQTKWGYEAAKSAVSQVAAGKNPSVSYGWSAQKRAVTQVVANLVVITSPLVRLYSIHNLMRALILHVILVKVLVLAMKRLYNKQNMMLLTVIIH